jgi:hypothetical protein
MQMLKTLFTKYFLEVVPSIVATVAGAYIVTHYINARPEADKPKPVVAAPAETSREVGKEAAGAPARETGRKPVKAEPAAPAEKPAAAPDKSAFEKMAPEKAEKQDAAGEPRRHQPPAKAAAKPTVPPAEAGAQADERRDANDLARAAIDRLRAAEPRQPESRQSDTVRAPEPVRPADASPERAKVNSVVYAPAAPPAPPSVQPLPPAVAVAPPPGEAAITQARPDDPSRPMPPADIPSRPIDLHARGHDGGSVAEEMVSAAKSVLRSVVPR